MVDASDWGQGAMSEGGERIQTYNSKMNKLWGWDVQCADDSSQSCIVYLKVTKKIDIKSSPYTHTHTL